MYFIFRRMSGWNKLTDRWGTKTEPPGTRLTRQTVKVGPVRWRFCVTMVLGEPGLYLRPSPFLGRIQPILVPWPELKRPRDGHLYVGWKAVEMSIGDPEIAAITFPLALYERLTPRIFPRPQ